MKKMQLTYGYDDVTLVPAYSNLKSRSDASVKMHEYDLPIIASCMDTLGYDLMDIVTRKNIPFIAHRAFKNAKEQWDYFIPNNIFNSPFERYQNIWWAVGSSQKYSSWIEYLYNKGVRKFCIDMAHGDSNACIETIKFIKNLDKSMKCAAKRNPVLNPTSFGLADIPVHIIAGNVATPEGFKRLQKAGANGIRIGIASGQICFGPRTLVTHVSSSGKVYQVQIQHLKEGDKVITKEGLPRKITKTFKNSYNGEIYILNNEIYVTPTHKFYVYDVETHEKIYKEIKDIDENRYKFIRLTPSGEKFENVTIDIDEYSGDVYNIEVDQYHSYCVGKDWFCVSNCSTAINTGFGVPILTNIIECKKVQKNGTWIIADGGIKNTGDIAKAVYFGADFCMIGKLFAATDKACGRSFNKNGIEIDQQNIIYPENFEAAYEFAKKVDWETGDASNSLKNKVINNLIAYKEYHGMASRDARKNVLSYASVEGVAGMIKYSGTTENFIKDTKLRLQASMSYAGARSWKEFRKNTYAVMRSNAGIIAGETHLDITLDK